MKNSGHGESMVSSANWRNNTVSPPSPWPVCLTSGVLLCVCRGNPISLFNVMTVRSSRTYLPGWWHQPALCSTRVLSIERRPGAEAGLSLSSNIKFLSLWPEHFGLEGRPGSWRRQVVLSVVLDWFLFWICFWLCVEGLVGWG